MSQLYSLYTLCILSVYSLYTLCILLQVLLEWCDTDNEGGGQREWVDLTNSEKFPSVYLEQDLLWARRVLASEQQRAVAWPARVSHAQVLLSRVQKEASKGLKWGIPHSSHH